MNNKIKIEKLYLLNATKDENNFKNNCYVFDTYMPARNKKDEKKYTKYWIDFDKFNKQKNTYILYCFKGNVKLVKIKDINTEKTITKVNFDLVKEYNELIKPQEIASCYFLKKDNQQFGKPNSNPMFTLEADIGHDGKVFDLSLLNQKGFSFKDSMINFYCVYENKLKDKSFSSLVKNYDILYVIGNNNCLKYVGRYNKNKQECEKYDSLNNLIHIKDISVDKLLELNKVKAKSDSERDSKSHKKNGKKTAGSPVINNIINLQESLAKDGWLKSKNCNNDFYEIFLSESRQNDLLNLSNSKTEKFNENNEKKGNYDMIMSLNTILYGPPGTGKTYNTKKYAVAICENKDVGEIEDSEAAEKFKELKAAGQIQFVTFHQSYGYEDFIEGIKPIILDKGTDKERMVYDVVPGIFKSFCEEAKKPGNNDKKFVFVIDEINRGNISKIFGELITLIEDSKRIGADDEMTVALPYSFHITKEPFGIPKNVYILGTMNTADRSIALLDTALRRRFDFIEMMPQENSLCTDCCGVNLQQLLMEINKRIKNLYDREHQIGHAYFIELKKDSTMEKLKHIFEQRIIPLLQEYFYDDYEKIAEVLGDKIVDVKEKKFIDCLGDAQTYKVIYEKQETNDEG